MPDTVRERAMAEIVRKFEAHEYNTVGFDRITRDDTRHMKSRSGEGLERLRDYKVKRTDDDIEGTIHLTPGLAMSEFGGTIKAKGKKYLAIPLPAALKADGTPKRKSARHWKSARVIKSKTGNLVIVDQRHGRLIPLYVLRRKARIPKRLGLRKALRSERAGLRRDVTNGIKRLLRD